MSKILSRRRVSRAREETRRVMRISTLDGLFAVQYATLTAGPFLTAFLVALGAHAFEVGLAAALPLLGGLVQPIGAEIVRRRDGHRKGVAVTAALVDALLWSVSILAVAWLPATRALPVVLVVMGVQQASTAVGTASWTSWISDLIPPPVRGRFFGTRNFVTNAFGAVTAAAAGFAIRAASDPIPLFLALIAAGAASRLVSIRFLSIQPEPSPARSLPGGAIRQIREPLAQSGFRRYVVFSAAWGFSVYFVAPFFAVYMLTQIGIGVQSVMSFSALGIVSNLVGQRVWGPLADRHGDRQVMRLAGLFVALQPFWWLFTAASGPGYYLMPLLSISGGFAWSGFTLATGNLMMRLAPETGKTSFFAVQAALGGAFGAAGPIVGGSISGLLAASWIGQGPFDGFKALFLVGGLLRFLAWLLMARVPEPVSRPRLRAVFVIRDTVRTMNLVQGFSPLLHLFMAGVREHRPRAQREDPGRIDSVD